MVYKLSAGSVAPARCCFTSATTSRGGRSISRSSEISRYIFRSRALVARVPRASKRNLRDGDQDKSVARAWKRESGVAFVENTG